MPTDEQNAWIISAFGIDPGQPGNGAVVDDDEPNSEIPADNTGSAGAASAAAGGAAAGAAAAPKAVSDAADKIDKTSDADLQKLAAKDQAQMLKDLQSGGKPSGAARAAQLKLLRTMKLDPDFKAAEDKRGDAIATKLKGDKDLAAARKDWGKLSGDEKVKALKKVVAAQSGEYGMPPPEIETVDQPPYQAADGSMHVTNGFFDPADGKLHLNLNAASKMSNFALAIDLVLHENGHKYQNKLVADLNSGKLKPGDKDYTEATIFAANDGASGYIPPTEDYATYVKQPQENHSRTIGAETSKKIMDAL
jgi:hypothetical protein